MHAYVWSSEDNFQESLLPFYHEFWGVIPPQPLLSLTFKQCQDLLIMSLITLLRRAS